MILLLILESDTNLLQYSYNGAVNDKSHISVYSNVSCMYVLMIVLYELYIDSHRNILWLRKLQHILCF